MSSPTSANTTDIGGRVYKRRPGACETCKVRKRKCNGGRPSCDKCLSSASFCFYVTPKKRGRSSQNTAKHIRPGLNATTRQSASFDDFNFTSQQSTSPPSPTDHLNYFGPSSTQSSLSGVNRLLDLGQFPAPVTTESLEEHWGPLSGGLLNSPDALGAQSTEIIASPVSSALDYCWSTQLLSNGQSVSGFQEFDSVASADWSLETLQTTTDESIIDHSVHGAVLMGLRTEANCCWQLSPHLNHIYSEILRLFEEVVMKGMSDHVTSSIVYAALSIGCSISMRQSFPSKETESNMRCFYSNAMVHVEKLHSCPPSALNFKALITMLTLLVKLVASTFWKPADTDWLLGAAVACAQSLRLNSLACLKIVCQTSEEVELLNHAFWLLYIIEKPFRLRNGQASALNNAYIDHEPMSPEIGPRRPSMQTFGVRYRLAQCCARIADEFDIQEALSRLRVDVFNARRPAPTTMWDSRIASPNSPSTTPSQGDISTSLLYFDLVVCVCGRFSARPLGDSISDKIEQKVLESAIDILKLLVEVDPTKAGTNQNLVRIAVSSFCLVATFISRANERATIFRYLVSTLGFFAQMTVTSPLMTLGKFSSVVDSVQKAIENNV
ncbi:hypothetical protein BDP81DRAFT_451750 [Colletotrichum phormii]|uniref:Zn(2)-C6 fungal-type domain-containing protein n=1 Tax=Colletotrichum phormii TaxID=359342 RepID=A0AAI9ZPT9_9PEZI|nr:uncharacterized protein BDP81DRAFT_451750 [Colletotrichum phormii]KAK1634562.1 hypothetical protein BDP81DRAFT_451750 [Colletotrichum phormii]